MLGKKKRRKNLEQGNKKKRRSMKEKMCTTHPFGTSTISSFCTLQRPRRFPPASTPLSSSALKAASMTASSPIFFVGRRGCLWVRVLGNRLLQPALSPLIKRCHYQVRAGNLVPRWRWFISWHEMISCDNLSMIHNVYLSSLSTNLYIQYQFWFPVYCIK